MQTPTIIPCALDEFLRLANNWGRARKRLFDTHDYTRFNTAFMKASEAKRHGLSYYAEDDAGSVANAYGNVTTTAQWGVWIDPQTHEVKTFVGRVRISGQHVPCPYYGGTRQYLADWRKAQDTPAA